MFLCVFFMFTHTHTHTQTDTFLTNGSRIKSTTGLLCQQQSGSEILSKTTGPVGVIDVVDKLTEPRNHDKNDEKIRDLRLKRKKKKHPFNSNQQQQHQFCQQQQRATATTPQRTKLTSSATSTRIPPILSQFSVTPTDR